PGNLPRTASRRSRRLRSAPRRPLSDSPALRASRVTAAVSGATFAMGMAREIRLELVEESPPALLEADRGETIAGARGRPARRFHIAALDEPAQRYVDRTGIIHEAKEIPQRHRPPHAPPPTPDP